MVEANNPGAKNTASNDIIEAISLGADIVWRGSSLVIVGGIFYYVPSIAAIRILAKPHEMLTVGHVAYDVCKLSYLIGKGVIYKLIQVKDCMLALKQKDGFEPEQENRATSSINVAKSLQ